MSILCESLLLLVQSEIVSEPSSHLLLVLLDS